MPNSTAWWRRHAACETMQRAWRSTRQADAILVREAFISPQMYWPTHLLLQPWVKRYPVSPLAPVYWKDAVLAPH